MASKAKKRSRKHSAGDPFLQAKHHLEKGNYKQALKDAKVCCRQQATPERRRLLEFAYIARAQELQRQGNRDACRGILQQLLELGAQESAVQAALPEVLLWAGMVDKLTAGEFVPSGDERSQWNCKVADQAVLRPDAAPSSMPDVREGAAQVRAALRSLYEGDHAAAQRELKDVARDSPFADWRLFARGLAAYYKEEFERAEANWSRLDPDRAATRIARTLSTLAATTTPGGLDSTARRALAKLERGISAKSFSLKLDAVKRHLESGEWKSAFKTARALRSAICEIDPVLYTRLVGCLYSRVVHKGWISDIDRLDGSFDALPLDPHWNRARALLIELSSTAELEAALPFWREYIDDLAESTELDAARRKLAQALVWLHMGGIHSELANTMWSCPCGASHDEEAQEAVEEAEVCLEKCLQLAPTHAPAYEALARLYDSANEPDKVAAVYRRALELLPGHWDALMHLTQYHLGKDEPLKAQDYAHQARRAKPLDRDVTTLVWSTHVAAARDYARRGEFDHARAQFDEADALLPERSNAYDVLGRKAILESKAGCEEAALQLVEEAEKTLDESAPLWLLMMIEAERYELAEEEVRLYQKRWKGALKRRRSGAAAGRMCQLMLAHLSVHKRETVHPLDVAELLAYVKKCTRVKWRAEDLQSVCGFLREQREDELLRKFVGKGVKQFPAVAHFHVLSGMLEIGRGPWRCNRKKARRSLQKALDLAKQSHEPSDQNAADEARLLLTVLEELDADPLEHSWADSDESIPDEEFDEADFDDFFSALPPDEATPDQIMNALVAICEELGIDPEKAMADMTAREGLPNPFARRSKRKK